MLRGIAPPSNDAQQSNKGNEKNERDKKDVPTTSSGNFSEDEEVSDCSSDSDDCDSGESEDVVGLPDCLELENMPSFKNISFQNSKDIHFGNKTVYQGPVTIKQFIYPNPALDKGDGSASNCYIPKLSIKDGVLLTVNDKSDLGASIPNGTGENICTKSNNNANGGTASSGVQRSAKWFRNISKKNIVLIIMVLALLLILLFILFAVLTSKHPTTQLIDTIESEETTELNKNTSVTSPMGISTNLTEPDQVKIVSRFEWQAEPPVHPAEKLNTPVPYVIIHYTASGFCDDQPTCSYHVRNFQSIHMKNKRWWDIGYNFLVGGDGSSYEGRGWEAVGAHTPPYNGRSIAIAFIGTFNTVLPPNRQLSAAKLLIEKGVDLGYIQKDYKLFGGRQLTSTQSPGDKLYEEIKTWPHWAETT